MRCCSKASWERESGWNWCHQPFPYLEWRYKFVFPTRPKHVIWETGGRAVKGVVTDFRKLINNFLHLVFHCNGFSLAHRIFVVLKPSGVPLRFERSRNKQTQGEKIKIIQRCKWDSRKYSRMISCSVFGNKNFSRSEPSWAITRT